MSEMDRTLTRVELTYSDGTKAFVDGATDCKAWHELCSLQGELANAHSWKSPAVNWQSFPPPSAASDDHFPERVAK